MYNKNMWGVAVKNCSFECKIMLVFLSGTSIATMFVSSAKFFELQSEVSEVQRLCGFGPIFARARPHLLGSARS